MWRRSSLLLLRLHISTRWLPHQLRLLWDSPFSSSPNIAPETYQLWTVESDRKKCKKPSESTLMYPHSTFFFFTMSETQNWEWSISSSHEAGLVGKSGYPVLLPVERSEVGPPAMALRACPTPPGPPCATRLSMLKLRLLRRGVWPGREAMEEGDWGRP